MKKLLYVFILCSFAILPANAQNTDQEIGLIGSILKSEIKVFFAQNIELKTNESETFWSIYDQYESDLRTTSNQRIDLLKRIIEKGDELTEKDLDSKISELNKISKKRIDLRYKYYKLYKKKINVKVASQFYQIDSYIFTHISAALNEGIPLIIPKTDE